MHVRHTAALALLAVALAASPSRAADDDAPPPLLDQIRPLFNQLSADAWKDRQAAQDKLVSFGDDAVPAIKQLVKTADDEEARTRAAAALRQIEENAKVGTTYVTLKLKDAKPEDVFAQLAKQAHTDPFNTFPPQLWKQNNPGPITIEHERVPFWTAFKDACQKAGVYPMQTGNDRRMALSRGSSSQWSGPSVIEGPFLVVANRIHRSDSVDLANPANVQHDFSISLTAFAEPKVKVMQSAYQVNVEEAVDDRGNSLVATDTARYGMNSGQQWMWNMHARLKYPEGGAGKTITRFKGTVRFLVQTKSETLDVPDILAAKNVARTVAGRQITIREVKATGDQYEVHATLRRGNLPQADWNAFQNPGPVVKLLDKDGKPLANHGWGGGGGGTEMTYTWNFSRNTFGPAGDKPGQPHRLVWEIPTETREIPVTFEFKDLPLP